MACFLVACRLKHFYISAFAISPRAIVLFHWFRSVLQSHFEELALVDLSAECALSPEDFEVALPPSGFAEKCEAIVR